MSREKFTDMLSRTWYCIFCIAMVLLVALAVAVLVRVVEVDFIRNTTRAYLHFYTAVGAAAFFVLLLLPRMRHNVGWLMRFSHEFTHMLFALIFFRKIVRMNVDYKNSHVVYSSGRVGYLLITLAPYCVPVFTLVLLPWRFTIAPDSWLDMLYLNVIDVLIGFTYAFHLLSWVKQTRTWQPDIVGPGVLRSLLVIAFFQIVFLSVVILTSSSGVILAFKRVFWTYPVDVIEMMVKPLAI